MPVIDTSCLIYLIKINKLLILKSIFSKVSITEEVLREMEEGVDGITELKEQINKWIFIKEQENKEDILQLSREEGIEYTDASLILLAKNNKDILVSNDSALIKIARIKGIECWWLTRCILESVKKRIMHKKEAKEALLSLVKNGMFLHNDVYAALLDEIDNL